jgi:hypothetical protein
MTKTNHEHEISSKYTPKRTIKTTYGSISGVYPFKNEESIKFESMLERDFLVRTETIPNVFNVISQPLTLTFKNSIGRKCDYTPDFLVNFRGSPYKFKRSILVEVKPNKLLRKHFKEWKNKFKAAFKYCNEHGLIFHFMDEYRIKDQRWKNGIFLNRYIRRSFDYEESSLIIDNLLKMGSATFDHLLSKTFWTEEDKATGISHIWHLVSKRKIDCDLSQPLTPFTELWISDNEYK